MRVSKRELAAAILLHKAYGSNTVNLGLILDMLVKEMGVTRRTALNIVKRLRKLGFLSVKHTGTSIDVEVRNPCSVIENVMLEYVRARRERAARLRG